ncbi:aminotransferase class V-fold PLP-dependent enzyme [Candidatus Kaiserbacteria bacterium]|nr:aminotransferase class V-fold PLP-dependent enzyme [Candidatus Kaiserbacteria bacterium]
MFWKRRTYLDSAAGMSGNPSSPHEEGRRAKQMLEEARTTIARLVEVQSDDVIFTSGATEANALAILGYVRALRLCAGSDVPGRNNMHVLYLPSAHTSIVENARLLATEGIIVEPLPIKDYRVDTDALETMLRKETVLVSMDAVCGETGVVWNTREVAEVLRKFHTAANGTEVRLPYQVGKSDFHTTLLHVDASQAPLTEKVTRAHFGADMLVLDASKVGEIRGIGALIAHRTIPLVPFYEGGGQERGLRPGSEAPELASRFAAALRAAARGHETFRTAAKRERARLIEVLMKNIPNMRVQEGRAQAPNILNLSLPDRDADYLVALLDEAGFALSTRSACETDSEEGSRAVFALTGDRERARSTLRVSWGPEVRPRELAAFAKALAQAVAFVDSSGRR